MNMLNETKNVRQIPGDPPRRWFSDNFFDLIVWFNADSSIWGFQLCYDREFSPRALTWTVSGGYAHSGIDDGENSGGMHKSSPVLIKDGLFDFKDIGKKLAAAGGLPPEILTFVMEKINEFKI